MLSKRNRSFIVSFFFFSFSLAIYIYPALPATCKDCGSIDNCLNGNGLEDGYKRCVLVSTEYGIGCQVYEWCGN